MTEKLNKNKTGLALGAFFAVVHAIWVLAVAIFGAGGMKSFIDWILSLHFITISYAITGFNFVNALLLVIVTFIGGYIMGGIFATVWNWIKKK